MAIICPAQIWIAEHDLLLLSFNESLHVLNFFSCVFHQLQKSTILINEVLLFLFHESIFTHDSVKDLFEFSGTIVLLEDDSRQRQLTYLVALDRLEETSCGQVLGEVLAEHHDLALGIMLTLDRHLGTLVLFVLYELAAWHLEATKLAFEQNELAVVVQVVSHPHANDLLDAKLADFDSVEAL